MKFIFKSWNSFAKSWNSFAKSWNRHENVRTSANYCMAGWLRFCFVCFRVLVYWFVCLRFCGGFCVNRRLFILFWPAYIFWSSFIGCPHTFGLFFSLPWLCIFFTIVRFRKIQRMDYYLFEKICWCKIMWRSNKIEQRKKNPKIKNSNHNSYRHSISIILTFIKTLLTQSPTYILICDHNLRQSIQTTNSNNQFNSVWSRTINNLHLVYNNIIII